MQTHPSRRTGNRAQLESYLDAAPTALTTFAARARFGPYALEQASASGSVVRLLPGVYVGARHERDPVARLAAVAAWAPARWCVGGATAVALHGGGPLPSVVSIVVPLHAQARVPHWVSVRWLPDLPRTLVQGLPVLRPAHAVVDAWHRAPAPRRAGGLFEAWWQGVATPAEVLEATAGFARVRGRRQLVRLAGLGVQGATSPSEVMAKTLVFTGLEYADWEWQAPVRAAGRKRTIDMLHRGGALAVEFDGEAYHAGADAWARDRQRDAELAGRGILTIRLSFADLRDRPQWCRQRVREALLARLPTLRPD